jgi:hypothetical protein
MMQHPMSMCKTKVSTVFVADDSTSTFAIANTVHSQKRFYDNMNNRKEKIAAVCIILTILK